MFATELDLGDASRDPRAVRWQLFCFREIRDVLPGSSPGTVVVLHTGPARAEAWRAEVRATRPASDDSCRPAG